MRGDLPFFRFERHFSGFYKPVGITRIFYGKMGNRKTLVALYLCPSNQHIMKMKTLKHILTILAVMFAGCPRTAVSCPTSIDLES